MEQLEISKSIVKYTLVLINFAYPGSPFGNKTVYIDYRNKDQDTNHYSQLRPYASKGVTFTCTDTPTLGFIVSSSPPFITDYPDIRKVLNGTMEVEDWNDQLVTVLEQALWARCNPSPVMRYSPYKWIEIDIALIMMDNEYSVITVQAGLNQPILIEKITDLSMIS